jgi:truncated hemoglobin YjbI
MPNSRVDLHKAFGGTETWRRLSVAFYSRVDGDPRIRHLFPGKTLRCATEELTAFLVQLFGGPSEDMQHRWWLSLRESHQRFKIGQAERIAWLENMVKALDDVPLDEHLRGTLREFFERSSAHVVPGATDPGGLGGDDDIRSEMAQCWESQRLLDSIVAAVRDGDAEAAITMAQSPVMLQRFQRDRSVFAGLLGTMMGSGNGTLVQYVQEKVIQDPALVRERYASRTLLHAASAQGSLAMVQLLLRQGADANAKDGGGHSPLYSLANEYRGQGGGAVVRVLVDSGAKVNADDGAKQCNALHMCARRGSAEIAEALLDCGANVDARDSLGDTPLRRAVNCDRVQVAALLIARGADLHSIGNKRLTPLQAARTAEMRQLLESNQKNRS